ncbi:MAG: DegT/DnrJ/EryC1/StrS family aminotransferase [Pseudomonadota bacterium]
MTTHVQAPTQAQALALHGGAPIRSAPWPAYNSMGEEEKRAVMEVMDSKVLSQFLGAWTPDFYGGPRVRALEDAWTEYFGCRHAVSMNSATSGLYAAIGAAGIGPGDEVIVTPYTMSASAVAALVYGAIPVFADIDPDTFCISPDSIRKLLSPRTRAIVAVDIFGHPAAMDEIMAIAREHKLVVIEDAAQAPGASLNGRYAGTLGHMGVFSLNYHKTIQSGEGGVVVTDDPDLADRLQLIRNHAEAVVEAKGTANLVNMVGFNYRMTEIEAAIAREQLRKLKGLLDARIDAAATLDSLLAGMPGITCPRIASGVRHGYYVYAMRYDAQKAGMSREDFIAAIRAEGIPINPGYVRPLYLQPMYQQRIAFGKDGYPFTHPANAGCRQEYARGTCPVTERMHYQELIFGDLCHANVSRDDLEDVARAFDKVLGAATAGRD